MNSEGFEAFASACLVQIHGVTLSGFVLAVLAETVRRALHEGPFWAVACCAVFLHTSSGDNESPQGHAGNT